MKAAKKRKLIVIKNQSRNGIFNVLYQYRTSKYECNQKIDHYI